MQQRPDTETRQRFALDEHSKEQKLIQLRQRFAAATPVHSKTAPAKLKRLSLAPRSLIAAVLLLLFLLSMLHGWHW